MVRKGGSGAEGETEEIPSIGIGADVDKVIHAYFEKAVKHSGPVGDWKRVAALEWVVAELSRHIVVCTCGAKTAMRCSMEIIGLPDKSLAPLFDAGNELVADLWRIAASRAKGVWGPGKAPDETMTVLHVARTVFVAALKMEHELGGKGK